MSRLVIILSVASRQRCMAYQFQFFGSYVPGMGLDHGHPSSFAHFHSLFRIFKKTDQLPGHILHIIWLRCEPATDGLHRLSIPRPNGRDDGTSTRQIFPQFHGITGI